MGQISISDLQALAQERSPQMRASIAKKITEQFASEPPLTDSEYEIAADILQLLARDIEVSVRKVLADNLKEDERIPEIVALELARDIEESVSLPVLEKAGVLKDYHLIEILKETENVNVKKAIARREYVSSDLSEAIYEHREDGVMEVLLDNDGAVIENNLMDSILESCKDNVPVLEALVRRDSVPVAIAEKLITIVTGNLKEELSKKYNIQGNLIESSIQVSKEIMTLGLVPNRKNDVGLMEAVNLLNNEDKLTFSLLLRAVCVNDLEFFVAGMAVLAGIPLVNAKKLMKTREGFKALFKASELPESMFNSFEVIVRFAVKEREKGTRDIKLYQQNILENILAGGYEHLDNMSYLIAIISRGMQDI
jgi:uncharacterized protein (DUF2336 family)